jgi:hypothetical protein
MDRPDRWTERKGVSERRPSTLTRRGVSLALFGAALSGCATTVSLRYRLTCTVLAGGQRVTATKVRELFWKDRIKAAGSLDTGAYRTRGEALFLKLGDGRLLIATLAKKDFVPEVGEWRVASGTWMPRAPFHRAFGGEIENWRRHVRQPVTLLPSELPLLVSFPDPADRRTVREVDPRDLAATFGPGFRLESMSVEVVREGVGRGEALRRLPWLAELGEDRLKRPSNGEVTELSQTLWGHNFRAGGV